MSETTFPFIEIVIYTLTTALGTEFASVNYASIDATENSFFRLLKILNFNFIDWK